MKLSQNKKLLEEVIHRKIGILGLGQMGSVLLKSISRFMNQSCNSNLNDIFYLYDPLESRREEFTKLNFHNFMKDEVEVCKNSKLILKCVKPDVVPEVITKISPILTKDSLTISIAAGTSIDFMSQLYQRINPKITYKICRVMTNHVVIVNEGGSVYSMNENCDKMDEDIIHMLLSEVGIVKKVDEKLMHAFTALTGSGPAFVYQFIESLIDAGLQNGIDYQTSREYAIQTVFGAAKFMKEGDSQKSPNTVQYVVTTPGGTTIAGLTQLNKHRFKYAVNEAITAACHRSKEIDDMKINLLNKNK